MNNNPLKTKYLDVLQIFRGIAAIMVIFHHSAASIKYYHKLNYRWLDFVGALGKYGVDFFFVLSGFIIAYSAYYKYNSPHAFNNYIKNRLARIYIPYLPIGIFMLFIYLYLPSMSNGNRDISIITSITLLPFGNPALSVAWTLIFELCFYMLFSFTFLSKKLWRLFVLIWILLIIYTNYFSENYILPVKNSFSYLFLSPYNVEFILGYLLSKIIIKNYKINYLFSVALIVILATIFIYLIYNNIEFFEFSTNFIFAIFVFLFLYFSIFYVNIKIKKTNLMMLVGNATYSIYLIHNPIQMIIIRLFPKINSIFGIFIVLVLTLIVSCFLGYLYYFIFENKLMTIIKKKITV